MALIKGIRQKTLMIFLGIFLLVITASILVSIFRDFYITSQVLGNSSLQAAQQASKAIDAKKVEKVIATMNDDSEEFKSIWKQLSFYKDVLGLKYLYLMTKNNKGEYIYLIDSLKEYEEGYSEIGEVEYSSEYRKSFERAMLGMIVKSDFTMDSKWGNLVSSYIPINNDKGKTIAFLGADLDSKEMLKVFKSNILTTFLCISGIFVLGLFAIYYFAVKLTDPIVKLRDYSLKVLNGEDVEPFEKVMKDEVGQLAEILSNRADAIKNILDNTGEGLLTFGSDLRVDREYSNECINIFKSNRISGQSIAQLLYPVNENEQEFIIKNLKKIFIETDKTRRAAFLSLLPSEVSLGENSINLSFKIIRDLKSGNDMMMLILQDITEKRALESKVEKEKNMLSTIVKILINMNEFSNLVNDYIYFTEVEIWGILSAQRPVSDKLYDIYRKLHTFKGDFSIYGRSFVNRKINEFEMELSIIHKDLLVTKHEAIEEYFKSKKMHTWLELDRKVLESVVGAENFDRITEKDDTYKVESLQISNLEEFVKNNLDEETKNLMLRQIGKLRYKPFNSLMKLYPDYMDQLAARLGKEINKMKISGGDFLVDIAIYKPLINSIIHIFRNAIDHGIESAEERIERNKPEQGTICCNIQKKDNLIIIKIEDDGQGIDLEKVKSKAIKKNLISNAEIENASETQIIELIFKEEFSIREAQTELSGRGMGLPAFLTELKKLGGNVVVQTKVNYGTSFEISIPTCEE